MSAKDAAISWGKNPQYLIKQTRDEEVEFFLSLAQDDGRIVRGSTFPFAEQIHPVCLIIYPCQNGQKATQFENKNAKPDWISTVVEHKEVSLRANLPKGEYLVVPCTREAGSTGRYYLSIYFDAKETDVSIKNLTSPDVKGHEIKEEDEDVEVSKLRITIVQARLVDLAPKNADKSIGKIFQK